MNSLFLVAVAFAVVFVAVNGKGTAKGKFNYNGDQCKWHEDRESGSMRSLNVQCGGKNPFSTSYEGNPHDCNWYLKGNQVAYYECLVGALKKANFCKNKPSKISCDKKKCGDVYFQRTGSHLYRLIMKAAVLKEEMVETENPDWIEFEPLNA